MNTTKKTQIIEKALNYMELIKTAEWQIEQHTRDIKLAKSNSFFNMSKYYEERNRIDNRIISRLNNRVNNLLKSIIS